MNIHQYSKFKGILRFSILFLLALFFAGLFAVPDVHAATPNNWYSPNWLYRKKITLQSSQVPANQTDFPVLVSLTDSNLASQAGKNAFDIVFTSSDGVTKLSHEIERFNKTANGTGSGPGQLEAWVKIPTLSSSANTDIYMYYGGPSTTDQQNRSDVWSNSFAGVWHLKENPTLTAPQFADSASSSNKGTSNGAQVATDQQQGKIDGGFNFDGTNDYVLVSKNLSGTDTITISFWLNWNAFANDDDLAVELTANCNTNAGSFLVDPNYALGTLLVRNCQGDGATYSDAEITRPSAAAWHHYVALIDRGATTNEVSAIYIDGSSQTITYSQNENTTGNFANSTLYFMSRGGASLFGAGRLDELRIADTLRSANWITTEYNNQSATSTFYTVGSQESRGIKVRLGQQGIANNNWYSPNWLYRKKITLQSSQVPANQTDFPVLVSLTDSNLASQAGKNAFDIVFTSSDGVTKLSHEIERFNKTANGTGSGPGQLEAWVKIPTLSSSANTDIYMYYGGPSTTDQQNRSDVWSNSFAGVWHLKENPTLTAPQFADSASSSNKGTSNGAQVATDQQQGKIDGGLNFDGTNDSVSIANESKFDFDRLDTFSISFWIKPDTTSTVTQIPVSKMVNAAPFTGWNVVTNLDCITLDTAGYLCVQLYNDDSPANFIEVRSTSATNLNNGNWHNYVFTYNGSSAASGVKIYEDGTSLDVTTDSDTLTATILNNTAVAIGSRNGTNYFVKGRLDEVRVSDEVRSANWITTEYNNQSATSTFYTVATQESRAVKVRLRGIKIRLR